VDWEQAIRSGELVGDGQVSIAAVEDMMIESEEDPLKQLGGWVWRSWNVCLPIGGRSAAANWTDPGLQARLDPIARELQGALEQGRCCADSKAATFCANLLALYPALWLFAGIEGVEPTNNHAERILRLGVLWRKNAFGCHSAAGCWFVERMLTVVQTLRLQNRPVLDYLHRTIVAHRAGLPAPQLLGQAGD
jgi:Transposase IS66 family